jgi:predicted transcriptional regulator
MAERESILGSVSARDAMIPEFRSLSPRDGLLQAVALVLNGWQQDFPVVDQGRVVGMLLRADIIATLASGEADASVREAMREDFPVASPEEPLHSIFTRLYEAEAVTVPVVENSRLVGLITLENMTEYLMVHAALSEAKKNGNGRMKAADLLTLSGRSVS